MNSSIPSNQAAPETGDTQIQSSSLKKEATLDGSDSTKIENRERETVGKELHEAIK
jgi:hypothetical protein